MATPSHPPLYSNAALKAARNVFMIWLNPRSASQIENMAFLENQLKTTCMDTVG
jgi:hypothetical protein